MKTIILLIIILTPLPAFAGETWDFRNVILHGCNDGDTCKVTLPGVHPLFGKEIRIRLLDLDTPELSGKCKREKSLAIKAQAFIRKVVSRSRRIDLVDVRRGKYFRIVGRIIADGKDVGRLLLSRKLARKTTNKSRVNWCR